MPTVNDVRVILERTFHVPVAESDAQFVLDRLNELASDDSRPTPRAADEPSASCNCESCNSMLLPHES